MTALFAHLPLGFGLARCGRSVPEEAAVFGELHLLDADGLEAVAATIAETPSPFLAWSAGRLPDPLVDLVDDFTEARPLSPADFAADFPELEEEKLEEAFISSGGWPEAIVIDDKGIHPSLDLVGFLRRLAKHRPELHLLAQIACCDVHPVPPDVLAVAVTAEQGAADEWIEELEAIGLLALRDGEIGLAVPAAEAELLPSAIARWRAQLRLAEAWRQRDPVLAATIAPALVGEAAHDGLELVAALRRVEACRDYLSWERLAGALARSPNPEHSAVGLLSSARLSLLRGYRREAIELLGRVIPMDRCPADVEATSHAVAVFGLESGNMLVPPRRVPLGSVLPGASADSTDGLELTLDGTAEDSEPSGGPTPESIQATTDLWIEASTGDISVFYRLTKDRSLLMNLCGLVVEVLLRCTEGRFTEARRLLVEVTGDRLEEVDGRLLQLTALCVASGTDVSQARALLPLVAPHSPGSLGAPLVAVVTGRTELMVGRLNEAWGATRYFWDFLIDNTLPGFEPAFFGDVLSAAYWSDNLGLLRSPATPELAKLHAAIADGDAQEAERVAGGTEVSPYLQARMMCLAADRHHRDGNTHEEKVLLQRAAASFSALGAPVDLQRTTAQARSGGHSLVTAPTAVSEQVTDTRQRVLELVARGLTNAEIAAELNLSKATIKRRISELLGEHSVSNRRQLGELARVKGL